MNQFMKELIKKIVPIAIASAGLTGLLAQGIAGGSVSVTQKDEEVRSPAPSAQAQRKRSASAGQSAKNSKNNFDVKTFSFNGDVMTSGNRLGKALIIRNEKTDAKAMSQLQEDLTIMSRVLEKGIAEFKDDHPEAAGIALLLHGGGPVRAMYLEGYGAIFTINVSIPLRPEPKPEEAEEKDDKGVNEEWQEARNEVLGQKGRFGGGGRKERFVRREFNSAEVEELKNSLTDALRNATNIRNLNGNDWITVILRGRGGEPDVLAMGGGGGDYRPEPNAARIWFEPSNDGGGESTMVLRVKKSDVDNLSKKDKGDLRAKISITSY